MKHKILLFFLIISFLYSKAQTLDVTFAPFFAGPSEIKAMVKQTDEKVIIAGNFVSIGTTYVGGSLVRLNIDGTVDETFNIGTGPDGIIYALALQPDGKILVGGSFTSFNGVNRAKVVRLLASGEVDQTFDAGTFSQNDNIQKIKVQEDGKILIANPFTFKTNKTILRLTSTGAVDETFTAQVTGGVNAVLVQEDAKIVIGGTFTKVNDIDALRLARLNSDGTLDETFTTNQGTGPDAEVLDLAFQSDEKIVVIGRFVKFNSAVDNFNKLARVNQDGSMDATFEDNVGFNSGNSLSSIAVQADDKIIVGGNFQQPKKRIIRLNSNGTADATFNVGNGLEMVNTIPDVLDIAIQNDGQVLIAGRFTKYNTTYRISLARLSTTGVIDPGYKPDPSGIVTITDLKVLPSGDMFVCGDFLFVNGQYYDHIVKLKPDGTDDNTFNISGVTFSQGIIKAVGVQSDGRVVVGGDFFYNDGVSKQSLARLSSSGAYDNSFVATTNGQFGGDGVYVVHVLPNDQVIIGGAFIKVNGVDLLNFARVNSNGTLDATFNAANEFVSPVHKLTVRESDGKMLLAHVTRNIIKPSVSLANVDGSRVSTFNIDTKFNNSYVRDAIFLPDGDILVGGDFTSYDGQAASRLVKVSETGVRDAAFLNPSYPNNDIRELSLLEDKILIGKGTTSFFAVPNADYLDVMNLGGVILNDPLRFNGNYISSITRINNSSSFVLGGRISKVSNEDVGSVVKLTLETDPLTGDPTELAAAAYNTPGRIQLTWTDNSSGESNFEVQRSTNNNSAYITIGYAAADATSYTDQQALVPGTTYFYKVRAVNLIEETGFSNEVSAVALPEPPNAPFAVSGSNITQTTISLSWSDQSSNESGFEIYRSAVDNTNYELIETTAANVTTFTDEGLTSNTMYFYKVRAINAGGNSSFATEINRTTLIDPPAAPSGLVVKSFTNSQVVLEWVDNSDSETSLQIFRSVENNTGYILYSSRGSNTITFTDPNVVAGTTYYYQVRATNAGGNSAFSNEVSQLVLVTPPAAPTNLAFTYVGSNGLEITWADNSSDETSFTIQMSAINNSSYVDLATVDANTTTYFIGNLIPSERYFFKVRASNGGVNSTFSNQINTYMLPVAPSDLMATGTGVTRVTLKWTDNSATETGYRVYRNNPNSEIIAELPANSQEYVINNVAPGSQITYFVKCFDSNNESTSSNTAIGAPASVWFGEWSAPETVAGVPARSNGISFVIGGSAYVGLGRNSGGTLNDLWQLDTTSNVWIKKADFPGTARIGAVAFTINGKGYVGTGNDFGGTMKRDFYEYDPATNTWTQKADFPEDFSSAAGITSGAAFAIGDFGYVGLGNTGLNNPRAFFRYDPANNEWTEKSMFGGDGRTGAVGFAIDGKGYFAFGYGGLSGAKADIWEYDPSNDVWEQKNNFTAAGRGGASVFTLGAGAYIVGGEEGDFFGAVRTNKVSVYAFNSWNSFPTFPAPIRSGAIAFSIGDKGYLFGGANGTVYYNDLTTYLPASHFLPAPPASATATFISENSIRVQWPDSHNETSYLLQVNVNDGSYSDLITLSANTTEYLHTGLDANTTYRYHVVSKNMFGGAGTFSNVIITIPIPAAPTNLVAVAEGTTTIQLSWEDNAQTETGYEIYVSTDGETFNLLTTASPNLTTIDLFGFNVFTDYTFKLRARGFNGNSEYSNVAQVKTWDNLPIAPSLLQVVSSSPSGVELSWTDNSSNETGFLIQRKSGTEDFSALTTTAANVTSFVDESIQIGVTYGYRVIAVNSGGQSQFAEVFVTVVDPNSIPPAAPSNLDAISSSQTHIELSWTDNASNESGFKILRKTGNESFVEIAQVNANVTAYTDNTVQPQVNYTYRVVAFNGAGQSSFSEFLISLPLLAPDRPTDLQAIVVDVNKVQLTWNDNSLFEDSFEIVREDKTANPYVSVQKNVNTFTDEGFSVEQVTYKVRAVNSAGASAYSDPVTISLPPDAITSIEAGLYKLVKVYPNPVEDHFKIMNVSSGFIKISMVNSLGVCIGYIEVGPAEEKIIRTEHWSVGLYLLNSAGSAPVRIFKK